MTSQFAILQRKEEVGAVRYLMRYRARRGDAFKCANSERAIEVNIAIMRAFVKLRQMLESNEELNRKFAVIIRKLATHDKYFTVVFDELKKLMSHPLARVNKSAQDRFP